MQPVIEELLNRSENTGPVLMHSYWSLPSFVDIYYSDIYIIMGNGCIYQ